MSGNIEAVQTAATVKDGRVEETAARAAVSSNCDSITAGARKQGLVERFLMQGAENAVPTEKLLELTGLDLRQLRKQVESERREGSLILTRPQGGYFLPGNGESGKREILQFYKVQRAKALSLLKTIQTAKKAISEIDGQQCIEV